MSEEEIIKIVKTKPCRPTMTFDVAALVAPADAPAVDAAVAGVALGVTT
jgi:hypothetical protein